MTLFEMFIYAVFVLTVSILVGTTAGFVTYHLVRQYVSEHVFVENKTVGLFSKDPINTKDEEF